MNILFVILFLICLILLFVGLINPSFVSKVILGKPSRKRVLLFLGGATLFSFTFVGITGDAKNSSTKQIPKIEIQKKQIASPTSKQKSIYEKVSYERGKTVENFYYLYFSSDKSKEALEKVIKVIKAKECKKPCNIFLYDDRKALELDLEYGKLDSIEKREAWKKQNYTYVAGHLLGYQEFSTDTFLYYPYR